MQEFQLPNHVPANLFVPGNIWENLGYDPHHRLKEIVAGRDIVYLQHHYHQGHSPRGCWYVCSAEAVRQVLLDTETFPSSGATVFGKMLGGLTFFPVEVDPPMHSKYRAIISPFFKPSAVSAMTSKIEKCVDALLDNFVDKGECEWNSEFARILPATIFLTMMGMPVERAQDFLDQARQILGRDTKAEDKTAALVRVRDYLASELCLRLENPRDDLLTALAHGEVDGRRISIDEATGGAMVLFTAGLDTVANLLGWVFLQLASDQEMQAGLRQDASQLSRVIEEMLRYFSPVTQSRQVSRDIELFGAPIKAGDTVCVSMTLASRDDKEFENPDVLNIDSPPRRHLVFGFGPHMCIGMHLAKLEAAVVIQRVFTRIPQFRIAPGAVIHRRGGGVLGVEELPLVW